MFSFLRSLFSSSIPSTASYENELFNRENNYARFVGIRESDDFKRYLELKEYVGSQAYEKELARIKSLTYSGSEEARMEKRFSELKNIRGVKNWLKKGVQPEQPGLVEEYLALKQQVENPEFSNKVKYLKNKKRYKMSDPYLCKLEFKELGKSEAIKTFFKLQKKYSKDFEEHERWISKLYDDFSKPEIDDRRWLKKPFLGEQLLNGATYSQMEELQIAAPENVVVSGGMMRIQTKHERKEGLAWNKILGFVPKVFAFTSGIVNSSGSYRQTYGRFEAKVRVTKAPGIYHAFWMAADTMLPHLNLFKFEGNKLTVSAYGHGQRVEQTLNYRLNDEFYIYTLLWTVDKITWLINGKKVFETRNIISEPMYIAFSSGVTGDEAAMHMPVNMDVDWVRCFRTVQ